MSYIFGEHSEETAKILSDFMPRRIFDAHMHISHITSVSPYISEENKAIDDYKRDMKAMFGDIDFACNAIVFPLPPLKDMAELEKSTKHLKTQLELHPDCVGEVIVMPRDNADDIEKRLVHPRIRGLKCYWIYSESGAGAQSDIKEYLPESAWEVANKRGMFITLHMVKDRVLADETNREYIKTMAKKYPNAVLILAHCARAFAAWTAFDTVDELKNLENVWFDFSGICESPAMAYIFKKIGVKRCMWGSDYPVSQPIGKCVSIGDVFYWIYENDLENFSTKNTLHAWRVGVENVMAVRQAAKLMDLTSKDIEDFFYNNAAGLMLK